MVPHTHWDREWYDPFQTFRLKLVRLVDGLLDLMERDSSYTHFMLDGQLAVVDDYLEIRPGNRPRLEALTAAGRISVGPWYILMDEFLVSGETIIRNLQTGMRSGAEFGGVMEVGYLPDMFGHVAQMPQILSLAGFEHAVVWRGFPRRWTGLRSDGTRLTARASGPSTWWPATATEPPSPRTPKRWSVVSARSTRSSPRSSGRTTRCC